MSEPFAAQFSDLSELELRHVAEGFDNSLWRVGDELVVRLPRRELAVALIEKELEWLPVLAPTLALPISEPVHGRLEKISLTRYDGEPGGTAAVGSWNGWAT